MTRNRLISLIVAVVIGLFLGTGQFKDLSLFTNSGQQTPAGSNKSQNVGAGEVAAKNLPKEAQEVISLIWQGGPFRYQKDGTVFQNRERRLPQKDRGYYREYTVRTPGASNRGARRIVAGGNKKNPAVMYYTPDHYQTFKRIVGARQ